MQIIEKKCTQLLQIKGKNSDLTSDGRIDGQTDRCKIDFIDPLHSLKATMKINNCTTDNLCLRLYIVAFC